jgi:class 3 adenylate cyclase
MLSGVGQAPQLDIAHVLFMDLVAFSRLPMEEQPRHLADLQDLVRATPEFAQAEASGDLLPLPTGDGMALVFFRDPVTAVQCAIRIGRALRDHDRLRLRIGLHSGPVYRVADINANTNVSGGGINLAQRVMDCGDAGHILLSSAIVELLGQVGAWPVLDLGECEVKHGARLHLFNLCGDSFGNPDRPTLLAATRTAPRSAALPSPSTPAREPERTHRVAILYKRDVKPDSELLAHLRQELTERGYRVFVDQTVNVGLEWAREIERELRAADDVIPLLSPTAAGSELLTYEVQVAHEAAQERQGRPRLLPVRVRFTEPLPDALAGSLGSLHQFHWQGPEDTARLMRELAGVLADTAAPPSPAVPRGQWEPIGGAVPLASRFYVERATDREFHAAVARQDSIVLVKGARQMGKTSLLARGLQQAREAGARVILTDFQKLNAAHLETVDRFLLALAEWIADLLDLDVPPTQTWSSRRGASVSFERFLRREVLGRIEQPIIWGLDEVDRLFPCGFASEVFGLFRSWHNERALDPTGPWARLTLAMAYATEAHLFITDVNQSPFNVGTRLSVGEFDLEQGADLNRRYGRPLRSEAQVSRYQRWLGGHPYLVHAGLHEMAARGLDLEAFEGSVRRDGGIFGEHLRRLLMLLAKHPELEHAMRGVLDGTRSPTADQFYLLQSAGLLIGETGRDAAPRCPLYADYLRCHLAAVEV